jgi:ornithine cyclodeaminase
MAELEVPHPDSFRWITEADVCELMDLQSSIEALERGLALEADGQAQNMTKTQTVWSHGSLNVTGAQFLEDELVGAKVWTNARGGAAPIVVMHSSEDGRIVAIVEAFALGQMRTAALSSVATRWCALEDADEMAIMGSGHQALPQVAAVAQVRKLKRVRVWSRTPAHRDSFARQIRDTFDVEVVNCDSAAQAAKHCPIITTFTRAREPFLTAEMLSPGTHVNAGGAILPTHAEIAQDVFKRCDRIVCDNLAQVRNGSRELIEYVDNGGRWDRVIAICQLVKRREPRPAGADLTLYKFMGMGLADMASAVEIYKRAKAQGLGVDHPHPRRTQPKLVQESDQ